MEEKELFEIADKMKPEKIAKKHKACREGLAWLSSYATAAEAWENCDRGDWMIWALHKTKKADKKMLVTLAIKCAERVLPIYEEKYKSKAPRNAIKAAKKWVRYPTEENKKAAAAADAAADAAAADAAAADAAADAAYAAAYAAAAAAAAAAYAAYAAAAAAYAAYAAAASSRKKEREYQAQMIRKVVGNPFKDKGGRKNERYN